MPANGNDDDNDNDDNIVFTIKDTKLYVPEVILSARDNQKLSKLLRKGFERHVYWNEYKKENKKQQMNIVTFSNHILLEVIDCLFWLIQVKMQILKDLQREDIIYQKNLLTVITLSLIEKTFMTKQLILI